MSHLWEVQHQYYCRETAWDSREEVGDIFESWAEFLAEFGESDMDYNLVFRWDWREGELYELGEYNGDDNYRHARLYIFFMGQRKGLFWSRQVKVCRADEPAIIAFLKPRLRHLLALWTPID